MATTLPNPTTGSDPVPTTMRVARCHGHGTVTSVTVEDVAVPVPGPGEVLIAIAAASVNFPDVLTIENRYQATMEPPFTPGSEFAGVICALGTDVEGYAVGDRVMGSAFVGSFAEYSVAPVGVLTRVPDGVDLREAAAFRVTYGTAHHALRTFAKVQPGEWVVVLGAAGGVGSATVELAVLMGARVLACASTDEKLAACRRLGAEATINYTTEDLKNRIKELTGGGADVVVDPVGGALSEPALRALRFGGRFICVGFASGEIARIPLNLIVLKGLWVAGFQKRTFLEEAPEAEQASRVEQLEWLAAGRVHPLISGVFPLERIVDALTTVAERRAIGKVVIAVRP